MALWDSLAKPILDSVTGLVSQFHLSPEDAVKRDQGLAQIAQQAKQQADDTEVKLNDIAGQNIRAEETSDDAFTRRARPAVVWMGNLLIFWNYGLVPVFLLRWHATPVVMPDAFWWTWGTVVTGYVFSRGAEKIAQMPGDSQVNVAGLLKIGNKS